MEQEIKPKQPNPERDAFLPADKQREWLLMQMAGLLYAAGGGTLAGRHAGRLDGTWALGQTTRFILISATFQQTIQPFQG